MPSLRPLLAIALAGWCMSCQGGYPLPATRCDDWCDAEQTLECGSYDPAGCVASCERRYLDAPACQQVLDIAIQCLRRTPTRELACETWLVKGPPPCADESQNLDRCASGLLY